MTPAYATGDALPQAHFKQIHSSVLHFEERWDDSNKDNMLETPSTVKYEVSTDSTLLRIFSRHLDSPE